MLHQEITALMGIFNYKNETAVIEDYQENSYWLNYI